MPLLMKNALIIARFLPFAFDLLPLSTEIASVNFTSEAQFA
jgi:hypothetical protein